MIKRITILGSTGSIGQSTIDVVRNLGPERVTIGALAAKSNIDLLEQQAKEFRPELIAVYDEGKARELQKRLPEFNVVAGMEGVIAAATYDTIDMVVSALVGTAGLIPTVAAIKAGKNIALANKEALVSGGSYVMALAKEHGVDIIPVDSEHSAIFQCLNGENRSSIDRIILTSSGGPFRSHTADQLATITVDDALKHPTWSMGPKVTIDSSTLMNKGLEVIEAYWLFGVAIENIDVVIHPQSLIHSMVEFVDGSIIAQMSRPTMLVPIQYAITYPDRAPGLIERFDFKKNCSLQFFEPDYDKFRCLKLAYDSLREGGSLPCYMNSANEVLVERFLRKEIGWRHISIKLDHLMHKHTVAPIMSIDDILEVEILARNEAILC